MSLEVWSNLEVIDDNDNVMTFNILNQLRLIYNFLEFLMWNFFRNIRLDLSLNGESLLIKRGDTQSLTLLEITCKNNAGNFIGRLIKTNAQLRNADVSRYKHECSGRYTLIRSVARIPSLPESPPAHPPLSATPVATYSRTRFPALPAAGRPPPLSLPVAHHPAREGRMRGR